MFHQFHIESPGKIGPDLIANTEEAKNVVQGRTQGNLVAMLIQLKNLADVTYSIFSGIGKLTQEMTERMLVLDERATQVLQRTLPKVEEQMDSIDPLSLCNIPRKIIELETGEQSNLFQRKSIHPMTHRVYSQSTRKPNFQRIDQLSGHKSGYTTKKYSNPRFFFERWYRFMMQEAEKRKKEEQMKHKNQKKKKKRKRHVRKVVVEKVALKKLDGRGAEFTDKQKEKKTILSARIIKRKVRRKVPQNPKKKSQKRSERNGKNNKKLSHSKSKKSIKKEQDVSDLPLPDEDIPFPSNSLPSGEDLPDLDELPLPLPDNDLPLPDNDDLPPPPPKSGMPNLGVPPPPKLSVPNTNVPQGSRSSLLESIRTGSQLQSAQKRKLNAKKIEEEDVNQLTVKDIMMKTMSIRKAVEFSDDESDEESDEEWDDW
ncbi:wasp family member 3a [Anaeramoeba flamelloides]|uniref:Wasp family member 3a n=1 Tax=Anaeramoeba flamelloides TaxID=1746091 RepID=A0AAV7YV72_9EUKA|nr:wasp family member 3a [Anaeramoeba flamelloides]